MYMNDIVLTLPSIRKYKINVFGNHKQHELPNKNKNL